jgi:branched-chain amino acid transport system ATP-binding protein
MTSTSGDLVTENIVAGYGGTTVLLGVDLHVPNGSVVALLGPNGAGKTTLLRTISGLLAPKSGSVRLRERDITALAPYRRAGLGVCLIPEGRGIFRSMTVRENLEMSIPPSRRKADITAALEAFPILGTYIRRQAGSLSGGEQQMLALSRAYLSNPTFLLVDELSMGLAPVIIDQIFASLKRIVSTGVSLLIVEQYVQRALDIADIVYLISQGEVKWTGRQTEITDEKIAEVYFGTDDPSSPGEAGLVTRQESDR